MSVLKKEGKEEKETNKKDVTNRKIINNIVDLNPDILIIK